MNKLLDKYNYLKNIIPYVFVLLISIMTLTIIVLGFLKYENLMSLFFIFWLVTSTLIICFCFMVKRILMNKLKLYLRNLPVIKKEVKEAKIFEFKNGGYRGDVHFEDEEIREIIFELVLQPEIKISTLEYREIPKPFHSHSELFDKKIFSTLYANNNKNIILEKK